MFQPYQEKENASQLHVLAPVHSRIHAAPVKAFQGNSNEVQTPLRKALGDRNSQFFKTPKRTALKPVNNTPANSMNRSNQQLLPAKPASKQHGQSWKQNISEKQQKLVSEAKPEVKVKRKEKKEQSEIEFVAPDPEIQDDFEDIWPKAERIESYLSLLHTWRPRKFAPLHKDPSSDSDDAILVDLDDSMSDVAFSRCDDFLPEGISKPTFEEIPNDPLLDYVPLPPLDYSFDSMDI